MRLLLNHCSREGNYLPNIVFFLLPFPIVLVTDLAIVGLGNFASGLISPFISLVPRNLSQNGTALVRKGLKVAAAVGVHFLPLKSHISGQFRDGEPLDPCRT